MWITFPIFQVKNKTYSDLVGSRVIRVLKMASEVPSTTPTAIIAG